MHERIGDIENPPSEEALNITESSSTTVETPSIEAKKKSRKRKRSEPQLAESCFPHKANSGLEPLYRSICSCVIQLQKLSTCSASGHHGFAVEHLKSALKSTPEQAAAILQNSVLLESQIITKELNDLTEDEFGVVDACLSSMVQIWESRSVVIDNPPDPLSKVYISISIFTYSR